MASSEMLLDIHHYGQFCKLNKEAVIIKHSTHSFVTKALSVLNIFKFLEMVYIFSIKIIT
jgi:hypothetical protein